MRHKWDTDTSTPIPLRILIKISQGEWIWCLIEYDTESENVSFGWHRFSSDSHLLSYTEKALGEPIQIPSLSLLPSQVAEMVNSCLLPYIIFSHDRRNSKNSSNKISSRSKKNFDDIVSVQVSHCRMHFSRFTLGTAEITRKQKESEIRKVGCCSFIAYYY